MHLKPAQSAQGYMDLRELAVLVLDDNANTRTLISEVLLGLGVKRVHHAADCTTASSVLRSKTVDIVLADIELDGEDGLDFVRDLRADAAPKVANAAVVMVSSHATAARVMQAGAIGADGFLSKPFSVASFARRFTDAIVARAAGASRAPPAPQAAEG